MEQELPGGVRHGWASLIPIPYVAGKSFTVSFGMNELSVMGLDNDPSRLEKLIDQFPDDPLVARVAQLLVARQGRPTNLFKIYEHLGNEFNEAARGRPRNAGDFRDRWIKVGWEWWLKSSDGSKRPTIEQMDSLRVSLHSESAVGKNARHALDEKPSATPMNEDE